MLDEYLEYLYVTGQLDSISSDDKNEEDNTKDEETEDNDYIRTRRRYR